MQRSAMRTIRQEQPGDAAGIHAVHAECFPTPGEARLVDALRAAGRLTVSVLAEVDGVIVGHVAVSPVTVASGAVGAGIGPVAVVSSQRRRGVAAELMRAALEHCPAAGFGWAVVLGDPAYYGRFGFGPASEFGLSDEFNGGLAFQAIELTPGTLPRNAGVVRYASEFASLG
jgi:putative acetyltransferase